MKMSPIVFTGVVIVSLIVGALIWRGSAPYREMVRSLLAPPQAEDVMYGPWSIGIYKGPSPFDLQDPPDISNPVLTGMDVTDVDAKYVADPFLVMEDGRSYLFFEVVNRATLQGDLAYAESVDGRNFEYKKIIIDEPFHLSYPYVFEWENEYYLIPESHHDLSVRLYKAISFPDKWEYLGNLLNGFHYADPSIVRYKDKWWLFLTGSPQNDALNIFYSDDLMKGWKPHPQNPVVKSNAHFSRPGGRVIVHENRLFRFAQDTEPRYGIQVFAFEVITLSAESYQEKMVMEKPVVTMSGEGWNAYGMHHIDPHFIEGQWIAAVDGRCSPSSKIPCKSFP